MNGHVLLACLKTAQADVKRIRAAQSLGEVQLASARAAMLVDSLVTLLEREQQQAREVVKS